MLSYIQKLNIMSSSQNGFCPGRSTESASYDLLNYIYHHLDNRRLVGTLFFDLSKAFDIIDASIIENKLFSLGFRGNFLMWLKSYLRDRKFVVNVHDFLSDEFDVQLGVPQGSILGPLIFILFINDLPHYMSSDSIVLYADDTTITVNAENYIHLEQRLNLIAAEFTSWCRRNSLIVNPNKTVCIHFRSAMRGMQRPAESINLMINSNLIEFSTNAKFLGLYLDEDLTWRTHIDALCKRINKSYYAMLQLRNCFNTPQLIGIYFALVYSHISFHIIAWGNSSLASRVFVAQKRIIRLIIRLKYNESCRTFFVKYNILPLPSIYIYKCIIFAKQNVDTYFKNSDMHSYNTRGYKSLRSLKHRTCLYENSPFYMGHKLLNSLPAAIRNISNETLFKNQLKTFLLSKCFYSVADFFTM
nr:unnamed protein product [Callosobruchus analis]